MMSKFTILILTIDSMEDFNIMDKKPIKFLPKDISKFPIVRIIGKDRFWLYQVKLDDGRIITYSKPIRGKNK